MKKKSIALTVALILFASNSQGGIFKYSYIFGSGAVLAGSFSGTANGNLITNLSEIVANLNGESFGPELYAIGYINTAPNAYEFVPNAAVVSIDGTQNQFMFADNSMYPGHTSVKAYFYSVTSICQDPYGYIRV